MKLRIDLRISCLNPETDDPEIRRNTLEVGIKQYVYQGAHDRQELKNCDPTRAEELNSCVNSLSNKEIEAFFGEQYTTIAMPILVIISDDVMMRCVYLPFVVDFATHEDSCERLIDDDKSPLTAPRRIIFIAVADRLDYWLLLSLINLGNCYFA
ncbi:15605_t:CDS:2 [Acaulospora morrowiae]|uniref:15605_t:CDS:1 n=1 Tax=Acaulospora morrowiae TaxID=94023 RepID=A0A9N9ADU4_9GLOM|nr:15605_t:CDS:2 [Acaulospora morrowiae]